VKHSRKIPHILSTRFLESNLSALPSNAVEYASDLAGWTEKRSLYYGSVGLLIIVHNGTVLSMTNDAFIVETAREPRNGHC
jgi:hypothetical protein